MKPKGQGRKVQPATAFLLDWELSLEQKAELVGASHQSGLKREAIAVSRWPPPVRPYMRPFWRFSTTAHPCM